MTGPVFQWLGTAGFRITYGDEVILIDPYLSRNEWARPVQGLSPADMADADYIFLSHGHFDHLADVPAIVEASGARVYCSDVAAATLVGKGVPESSITELYGGKALELDGFEVKTATCPHIRFDIKLLLKTVPRVVPEIRRLLPHVRGMPAGPVLIFTLQFEGLSVMHLGSLGVTPAMARKVGLGPVDILMPPLQGHTDICRLAAELTRELAPRAVIPHHHDDFFPPISQSVDIEHFRQLVGQWLPDCAYYEPQINRTFSTSDVFGHD